MRPLDLLLRLGPATIAAPIFIFIGLATQGADTIAQALALSFCLLATLALAIVSTPGPLLASALHANRLPAHAILAFVTLSAMTALPLPPLLIPMLAHPVSTDLDWQTPAISIAPTSTLLAVFINLAPPAAFALGTLAAGSERAQALTIRTIVILAIVLAALSLVSFSAARDGRLDAGLPSANAAAALFGSFAVLGLARMIRTMRHSLATRAEALSLPRGAGAAYAIVSAPVSSAAIVLALLCVLLTGSRGGAVVITLGLIAFFAAVARSRGLIGAARRTSNSAIWGAIAALAALAAYGAAPLLARFDAGWNSMTGRGQLLAAHWNVFLQRPWLGHGQGSYDTVNLAVMDLENYRALRDAGAAHNVYVQALEEVGIVGVVLLALALAQPLWRALAALAPRSSRAEWRAAALGITVIFITHGAFDFALQVPAVAAFYFFCLGLLTQPAATRA